MLCASCSADLPDSARFCFSCGMPAAPSACSSCGEPLVPHARFCMSCGTPQPHAASSEMARPVSTRRTTSVLFGDLVGFTALSETRDQEDVRELLSRYFAECQQVIVRYGGTVEKFIGDAVMAVWGVPTAHEDDAERAVRAGLELVAAVAEFAEDVGVPELTMRVGIVTGEVAVTVGATDQGMVAGDAVNTASRVQAAAAPGSVWVDETTRLLTTAAITYADVGSHRLKGKADPMPLWSVRAVVAAVGGAQRADGLEAPLVGRDRELRLVKELFHQCEESGRPMLLVVDGEPGVGKSRLSWEFEKYVDGFTSTVRWHSGRCVAYGEGVAYFALAEAIRGRLQALSNRDSSVDEDVSGLLERALELYVADETEQSWLQDRLAALLGIGSVGTFAREDLFSAWVTFLERVGGGDPVTLMIDDAQHADEGMLAFVEHLLTVGRFACFVVLLTRPGLIEARPALATHRQANVIHLPTLHDRDMAQMLDGLVSGLPDAVRDGLVARSDGVPLFAVETVRSLIDRDLVVPRGGQYVLADGETLDLDSISAPASLQALIAARLDTLTPAQRTLVDRASVLGLSFSPEALADLCTDVPDSARVLNELVRLQILSQESGRMSASFGHYRFVQSAVRQVAYGTLSRRDRKWIHLAVAEQFARRGDDGDDTAAIRAQHYLDALAAVPGDPDAGDLSAAALDDLRRAGSRARALGSPAEGARHLRTAITLTDDPATRGKVGCELARAEMEASEFSTAMLHADEAKEILMSLGDRLGAGLAAAIAGSCLTNGSNNNEQALEVVEPWWEELRDREDAVETLMALSEVVLLSRTRLQRDLHEIVEARLKLAERAGSTEALADCYNSLAVYYSRQGAVSLSAVLLEASADLARRHHDLLALSRSLINIAAYAVPRDLARAVEVGAEAVTVARRTGTSWRVGYAEANYTLALWNAGDWDGLDTVLSGHDTDPDLPLDVTLVGVDAARALVRGTPWQAPRSTVPDDTDDIAVRAWVVFTRALRHEMSGDLDSALVAGIESVELMYRATSVWDDLAFVWAPVTATALRVGDDQALQRLLSVVDGNASNLPRALRGHRTHVKGLLAWRDRRDDEVEPALTEAVETYTDWGSAPYRSRAQADLGRWLMSVGRTSEGSRLIDEARSTYERLGARRWLDELEGAIAAVSTGAPSS